MPERSQTALLCLFFSLLLTPVRGQDLFAPNYLIGKGAAPAAPFTPTNIAGFPAVIWLTMATNGVYTTNIAGNLLSDVVTWQDLSTNNWSPTNNFFSAGPVAGIELGYPRRMPAFQNGMDVLAFTNDTVGAVAATYLRYIPFAISQPCDYVLVANIVTLPAVARKMIDNCGTAPRQFFGNDLSQKVTFNAGTSISSAATFPTNKWYVFKISFNGASSSVSTNLTAILSGNPNTGNQNGLTFGIGNTLSASSAFDMFVAEVFAVQGNMDAGTWATVQAAEATKWGVILP